jgi:multidrug efflux pump subunit AcrB
VSERGFAALQGLYARCLDWILRHQVAALVLTVGTVAFTVFLYIVVPKGLFPQQDTGMLMGSTEASQDVSFPAMKANQEQVNASLLADPDVEHVTSFIGSANASTGNAGNLFIALRPKPGRKSTADEVIARLRPKVGRLAGIRLFLQSVQDLRVQGQFPSITLSFNLAPGTSLGDAVELIRKAEKQLHYPDSLRGSFMGTAQAFKSSTDTVSRG